MQDKQEIIAALDVGYLQRISRSLIDMYRSKQERQLSELYTYLFPGTHDFREDTHGKSAGPVQFKKQFIALIKLFHPDTYNYHHKQILDSHANQAKGAETTHIIDFYQKFMTLESKLHHNTQRRQHIIREAFSTKEEYAFEEDFNDFNLDEYFETDVLAEKSSTQNIYSIISSLFLGNNLSADLGPIDLQQIDGELILSNHEIEDLDGIQHCIHLNSLDLSNNLIDNIYELRFLENLEELDLSYNHLYAIDDLSRLEHLKFLYLDENSIEEISSLLTLPSLEFVSLIGNPLSSMNTIYELQEKNVVVVYF